MTDVVVDASALVALVEREPASEAITATLESSDRLFLSAGSIPELGMVLGGRGSAIRVETLIMQWGLEVVAVDGSSAMAALDAWRRWGKGRHPAGLNDGDCFVYALAEARGVPVVAIGDDFRHTDLVVLPSLG